MNQNTAKQPGIVRRLDDLGRIVIPKEIRRRFGLSEGMALEMSVTDDGILLKPYFPYDDIRLMVSSLTNLVCDNKDLMDEDLATRILNCAKDIEKTLRQAKQRPN